MDIAIVGAWVKTRLDAPYGDPLWEIWTCSYANANQLPRADAWFELHKWPTIVARPGYVEFLRTLPNLFMQAQYLPNATPLDVEPLIGRFGRQWFRNTHCYMLARAINRQPERIWIGGVGPKSTTSQPGVVPALQHLIAMARRDGILVECPAFLDAPNPLYAFEEG